MHRAFTGCTRPYLRSWRGRRRRLSRTGRTSTRTAGGTAHHSQGGGWGVPIMEEWASVPHLVIWSWLFLISIQINEHLYRYLDLHNMIVVFPPPHRFGTADFDAVGVGAFYAYWSTFSTFKSFSWADVYNPASAPNRWELIGGGTWESYIGKDGVGDFNERGFPLRWVSLSSRSHTFGNTSPQTMRRRLL